MNIKEASQQTGVTATTIRYYEKEGLIPAIDRNDVGVRAIDDRIIRRINFVKTMRAAGMSIEALKEYIRLFDAQEDNTAQQFKLLNEQSQLWQKSAMIFKRQLTICAGRLITMKIIWQSRKKN